MNTFFRSLMRRLAHAGAALLVLAAGTAHAFDAASVDVAFDDAFARYRLPGLAIGVIVDGEVVYRRTGGELVAGSGEPVTPDTLFKIASNSKAMTTAVLARLVDAGKLGWDDPVHKHLPQFRMHDPWVGANMQVRDLLLHNSGLGKGAGDLMLWPEPNRFTRADVIAGLAHLVPVHGFRAQYAYDNILYIVAGEVAAAVAGVPWEMLVHREVFGPLGMDRCQAGGFELDAIGNVAQAHMHVDGRNVPIRLDGAVVPTITSAPAGGIRCSLDDMLTWARMWLGATPAHAGSLSTDQSAHSGWLSAERRKELWTPHMPLPVSDRQRAWDGTHFHAYGYGWRLSDVDGNFVVGHTGTLGGMYSALVLLPDRRSGFMLMTNGPGAEARTVLTQVLLDQFTAPGKAGTVAHYAGLLAAERTRRTAHAEQPLASSPRAAAEPSSLGDLPGIYRDPWFGEVAVCAKDGRVRFEAYKSPRLAGTLMRVEDRLLVDWDLASVDAEPWLHFADGDPVTLALSHVDPDADFSYDYADLALTRVRGCGDPPHTADEVEVSSAGSGVEAGLLDIALVAPDIDLDIRYAGTDNFVGTVVDGYEAPRCWLLEEAAMALQQVSTQLRTQGLRLRVFDCYRPVRAVKHFVRWARDADDLRSRPRYYPNLDKSALLGDYIAESSGHSRGATLDLTLLRCTDAAAGAGCEPLDMGTPFDFFDPSAHTDSTALSPVQAANRALLRDAMARGGFANYPLEWWHYTWSRIPAHAPAHDVVVR